MLTTSNQSQTTPCSSEKVVRPVNLSLASYPRLGFMDAMLQASSQKPAENGIGNLSLNHVQLCPQNRGVLDVETADALMTAFPETQFRLHANVRVHRSPKILDWADWNEDRSYWTDLAGLSKRLRAPAYTAHAGLRSKANLETVLDVLSRAEQVFECPVAVEHHYPTRSNQFLLSTWKEMEMLLESNAKYVIDLSHMMIIAHMTRRRNDALVRELLSSDRCIEVHLSWNDGFHDQHHRLPESVEECWWWDLIGSIHPSAVVFSEGMHREKLNP